MSEVPLQDSGTRLGGWVYYLPPPQCVSNRDADSCIAISRVRVRIRVAWGVGVQAVHGYLAHKKPPLPRPLQQAYA